jgi:hypothetical protein
MCRYISRGRQIAFSGLFAFDMGCEQPEQARTRIILNDSLLNKPVKTLKAISPDRRGIKQKRPQIMQPVQILSR